MPSLSVITSTFNSEKYLGILASSIRKQSSKEFEWIIVDGKSSDKTLQIIEKNKDIVSSYISEPDEGIYDAWNKGIKLAKGEWICFIGSDDFFLKDNAVEEISSSLVGVYPKHRISYRAISLVNLSNETLYTLGESWCWARKKFKDTMTLPHPGLMHHRTLFDEIGLFDTSFKISGDYEFLLRALRSQDPHFCEGHPLVAMRLGGISSDPKNSLRSLLETRKASKKHGRMIPRSSFYVSLSRIFIRLLLFKTIGERRSKIIMDYVRSILGKPPHWTRV